jgi:phosphinothricin acetyltransferase
MQTKASSKGFFIRKAEAGDLTRINEIYNHYVTRSTCTFQVEPETLALRTQWFNARNEKYPVMVAVEGGKILGWGAISRFKKRAAYAFTGELSVYVDFQVLHRGIGEQLLRDLLERAKNLGFHTLISIIAADQAPSLMLHEKLGFYKVARLEEVGYKFNRWLDVIYMQYRV